jgi:hypothetical protein
MSHGLQADGIFLTLGILTANPSAIKEEGSQSLIVSLLIALLSCPVGEKTNNKYKQQTISGVWTLQRLTMWEECELV